MNEAAPALPDLNAMRAAGAARLDAVGWHYIETLAMRTQAQSGLARVLLHAKLQEALQRFDARMTTATKPAAETQPLPAPLPSRLAVLLQDMGIKPSPQGSDKPTGWPFENPRIEQFRLQLSKISVQKQINQAMAQAPQNAGPINSHMLVLRSLSLMRDISPDYLNRFMTHVDTLLRLQAAGQAQPTVIKKSATKRPAKNPSSS